MSGRPAMSAYRCLSRRCCQSWSRRVRTLRAPTCDSRIRNWRRWWRFRGAGRRQTMSHRATPVFLIAIGAFCQAPQTAPPTPTKSAQVQTPKGKEPGLRYVESGSGVVAVNPAQPYRPIPVGAVAPRDSIFGFYLRVLNPQQINWGTEIDRRLANLREQSIDNPYFRLASFQVGLIVILLMLCWVWWDKMRQIKWVAAECLTDALNAKTLAESRALEAIDRHNRHIELCNRVIEGQSSGIGGTLEAGNSAVNVRELQTELAA